MESKDKSLFYRQELVNDMQYNIRKIRKMFFKDIDQSKFAEYLGLTRQTYGNIENKKKHMTNLQYVAICSLLDQKKAEYINDDNIEDLSALLKVLNKTEWIRNDLSNCGNLYKYSFLDEWMKSFVIDPSELPLTKAEFIEMARESFVLLSIKTFDDIVRFDETLEFIKYMVNEHRIDVYIMLNQLEEMDGVRKMMVEYASKNKEIPPEDFQRIINFDEIKNKSLQAVKNDNLKLFSMNDSKQMKTKPVIQIIGADKRSLKATTVFRFEECRRAVQEILSVTNRDLEYFIKIDNIALKYAYKNNKIYEVKEEVDLTTENILKYLESCFTGIIYKYRIMKGEKKEKEMLELYNEQYKKLEKALIERGLSIRDN